MVEIRISTKIRIRQIESVLKKHKSGIWVSQLARIVPFTSNAKFPESAICYYLYGLRRDNKLYGGFFKDKLETIKTQGRNRFIRLKS